MPSTLLRELDRRLPGDAAVGDVEVLAQVVARLFLQRLHRGIAVRAHGGVVHVVEAVQPERQRLAHVADDTCSFGKRSNTPAMMRRSTCRPVSTPKPKIAPSSPRSRNGWIMLRGGVLRVHVDRHVERLGRIEDRPELRIVEVFAVRVRVDDHAVEAELRTPRSISLAALPGVLRRDRRHAREARGVAAHRVGQLVVGHASEARPPWRPRP